MHCAERGGNTNGSVKFVADIVVLVENRRRRIHSVVCGEHSPRIALSRGYDFTCGYLKLDFGNTAVPLKVICGKRNLRRKITQDRLSALVYSYHW